MADEKNQLFQQVQDLLDSENSFALSRLLKGHRTSDIAEVVELLDNEHRRVIFDVLEKPESAEVLEKVDEGTRNELFELLQGTELAGIVLHLDPDDAADILLELPTAERAGVLESIPPVESTQIKELMSYSEDSAGGIMDPVLISVDEDATVAEAVNKIRAAEIDEDFFSIFVVGSADRFIGNVRIRLLLTSQEKMKIKKLIDTETIYVLDNADQEEVRNIFSKNDLIVVPVLDKKGRLVGRITADRVIEVAEEEAAEDMYAMAGTDADELEKVSVLHAARVRMTWLLPCLLGTAITAVLMMFFKGHNLSIYVTIAAFVPMIAAISGNAGLQTSTIVVTGLATGHLAAQKLSQVFAREVRIAFFVAASCGILGGIACAVLLNTKASSGAINPARIAFAFSTAMFSAIMVATTLGLFLPFLFRRIGIDPAISSGPLVTTANDSISVAIYMTLALLFI